LPFVRQVVYGGTSPLLFGVFSLEIPTMSRFPVSLIEVHYDVVSLVLDEATACDRLTDDAREWPDYSQDIESLGRFAVMFNLPGCLPDCDPDYFDTMEEAEQRIRELRAEGRELYGRNDPYAYSVVDVNERTFA
jgi:hypothetical protein